MVHHLLIRRPFLVPVVMVIHIGIVFLRFMMLWFVMLYGHRLPVVFLIPTMHRLTFAPLAFRVTPLVVMMLARPAIAIMIANLLMMLVPLE
jgi:hypothetical protein